MIKRLAVVLVIVVAYLVLTPGVAHPAAPTPCLSTSDMPRTYTHGSPITGLVPRHGYYYLDVKQGPGCTVPAGAGATVHLVATVAVRQVLPAVGDLAGGVTPAPSRVQTWWLEFHNSTAVSPTGQEQEFTIGNTRGITWSGETMPCKPDAVVLACQCEDGTQTETFRYDGPDVFRLDLGNYVRFRVANESTAIVTDYATLSIATG